MSSSSSHSSRKCRVAGILLLFVGVDVNGGVGGVIVGCCIETIAIFFNGGVDSVSCEIDSDFGESMMAADGDEIGIGGSIDLRGLGGGAGGVLRILGSIAGGISKIGYDIISLDLSK